MIPKPARSEFLSRLRHRPLRAADLAECIPLLPAYLGLDDGQRAQMAQWWARSVDAPGILTGVIEDGALPAGQRIQGWGVSLIVPPALRERLELDRGPRSHLAR